MTLQSSQNSENPYAPSQIEVPSAWSKWDSLTRKQFVAMIVVLTLHIPSFFTPIIQNEQPSPSEPLNGGGYSQSSWRSYRIGQNLMLFLKCFPFAIVGMLRFRNRTNYSIITAGSCLITAFLIALGIRIERIDSKLYFSYYFELASVVLLTLVVTYSRSWIIQRYPHSRKFSAIKVAEDATLESES